MKKTQKAYLSAFPGQKLQGKGGDRGLASNKIFSRYPPITDIIMSMQGDCDVAGIGARDSVGCAQYGEINPIHVPTST
jgi:hypothetical protein